MPHIHELYDFTTSAFIIHPTEPKILLLQHKKIGKWLQPGGHIELDENITAALEHELIEESGLRVGDYEFIDQPSQPEGHGSVVLPIPFHINEHSWDSKGTHRHIDFSYLLQSKTSKITKNPDGALAIGWKSLSEIKKLNSDGKLYDGTMACCEWIAERYFDHKL